MQVRAGDATCTPDQPNHLPSLHGVAGRYERLAHVEIRGDDPAAVIDVDHIPREKEVVDERNHPAIRRANRLADRAAEINAEVARRECAVEKAPGSEFARHYRTARLEERCGPHRRVIVRIPTDLARTFILTIDSRGRRGVEWLGKAAVDGKRLSNRRWHFGKIETHSRNLSPSGRAPDFRDSDEGTLGVDGDSTNRMPGSRCQMHEMKRLASQPAAHGYDGIAERNGRVERQTHDRSGLGPNGSACQSCGLCVERSRKQGANSDRFYKGFHVSCVSVEFHRS